MLYVQRKDNQKAFVRLFRTFTDAVGGDPVKMTELLYARHTVEAFQYADDWAYEMVFNYFRTKVIPHKIEVYNAGLEMLNNFELPYLNAEEFMYKLWEHDLSKFCANEAFGYGLHDFSKKHEKADIEFDLSWAHHKNHNDHHPEYFLNVGRDGKIDPLPMNDLQVSEMICDWIGAGKIYGKPLEQWLPENLHKFVWHKDTAIMVSLHLAILNIETEINGTVVKVAKVI